MYGYAHAGHTADGRARAPPVCHPPPYYLNSTRTHATHSPSLSIRCTQNSIFTLCYIIYTVYTEYVHCDFTSTAVYSYIIITSIAIPVSTITDYLSVPHTGHEYGIPATSSQWLLSYSKLYSTKSVASLLQLAQLAPLRIPQLSPLWYSYIHNYTSTSTCIFWCEYCLLYSIVRWG